MSGNINTTGNISLSGTGSKLSTNNMINPFSTNPTNDGQVLSSNTNGNLSWITPPSPVPTPASGTISYIGSYTYTTPNNNNIIFNKTNFGPITINGTYLILTLNTVMQVSTSNFGNASLILNGITSKTFTSNKFYAGSSGNILNLNLTFVEPITAFLL